MRDLGKTLKLFEREFAMDFCMEFNRVKSILDYMNRHVKPFSRLHFRSGNEPFITEAVRRMQTMFEEMELIDPETKKPLESSYQTHRKILLFLVASTDATYKYNLRNNSLIAHVLELCPLMPKFLFCALVWDLHMERFFFEMLAYAPCWFTFQFVEGAVESLKYVKDAFDALDKVAQLLRAILICVTRSRLLDLDRVDSKCILTKLYDSAIALLRQFYTPDSEKFQSFKKDKLLCYRGHALRYILQLVLFAMDVYENPAKAEPNNLDIDIYEIVQMPYGQSGDAKHQQAFREYQRMLLVALLNSLQYNIMLVKLDDFLAWTEVELEPTMSLQRSIGEMAYAVNERMAANTDFEHDVAGQINAISIQPKTLEQTMREATIGEILLTLDKPLEDAVKSRWLGELLKRKVAFGNDECLCSIRENIALMNYDHCIQILEYLKWEVQHYRMDSSEFDESVGEHFAALISILWSVLPNLSTKELLELLTYQRINFYDCLEMFRAGREDFLHRLNTFLNKYAQHFVLDQFLHICFEFQTFVWEKLFEDACLDEVHMENFCQTIEKTSPYSDGFAKVFLCLAMEDKLLGPQFPQYMCRMFFALYHPHNATEFLKDVINRRVCTLLEAKQFELLLPIVRALNLIDTHRETQSLKPLDFGDGTSPVLVMAAQIMEKARWDLITYTTVRDDLVRECIQFIQNVSKKFLPVAREKDRKWLTKHVTEKYRPLTQFYFQKYALTPNEPQVEFDRFLMNDDTTEEVFLIVNFVRCTMRETEWLARNDQLLAHMSDVMILLSKIVIDSNDGNAINSYRHCLTNYANIVMKFLLPQAVNDCGRIEKLLVKILKIINSTPDTIYNEIFMNFESLLLDVVQQSATALNEDVVKSVRSYVTGMRECQAQRIFLEKFVALATETTN